MRPGNHVSQQGKAKEWSGGKEPTFQSDLVVVLDSRLLQFAVLQAALALQVDVVLLTEELRLSIGVELVLVLDLYLLAD